MKWCLFLVLFWIFHAKAQTGLNISYDFESLAAGFSSIESHNDTIIIYGVVVDNETKTTGLLFSKIDTFGNVLSSTTYFDKDGDKFTRPYQNSFIKLSDNSGYVGIGQLFAKSNGYFIHFDNEGNVINYKEYLDTVYTFNHFKEILEIQNNSFLIVGNEAFEDQDYSNGFILKINLSGEIIWETKITDSPNVIFLGSIVEVDTNRYLVGGLETDQGSVSVLERKYSSLLLQIDTDGNVISTWNGERSLEECGVGNMELTPLHGIMYNSLKGEYNKEFNDLFTQPILIQRDSSYELIVRDTFGAPQGSTFNITNIHSLSNGDWLTVGVKPQKYSIPPDAESINSLSGWINRFEENGDNIWSVTDTAFWSSQTGSNNLLYDAVELSSGSIIACGYNRTNEPEPKDWGWLLKVSKDGCLDTLCNTVAIEALLRNPDDRVVVFPNPAAEFINFELPDNSGHFIVEIYSLEGIMMDSEIINYGISSFAIDKTKYLPGLYLWLIKTQDGQFLGSGKVIVVSY